MTELGLRERKKLRTRRALESAALGLFEEQGFSDTTVDQIAERAEVSPRTFFHHFATKEDVVLAGQDERFDEVRRHLAECAADAPPLVVAREAVRAALPDAPDDGLRRRLELIESEPSVRARARARQAEWETAIAGAIAERLGVEPDRDLRPRLVASVAVAAMRTALELWATNAGDAASPRELLDRGIGLLAGGLGDVQSRPPAQCTARASS